MSSRNIEYTELYTFTSKGDRINLITASWDKDDIGAEYNVGYNEIETVNGWIIADYDDLSREYEVYDNRGEATLDMYGEDSPMEVR